jgi:hypothetical protein
MHRLDNGLNFSDVMNEDPAEVHSLNPQPFGEIKKERRFSLASTPALFAPWCGNAVIRRQ